MNKGELTLGLMVFFSVIFLICGVKNYEHQIKSCRAQIQEIKASVEEIEKNSSDKSPSELLEFASKIEQMTVDCGKYTQQSEGYQLISRIYSVLSQKGNGEASYLQYRLLKDKLEQSTYMPYLKLSAEQGYVKGQLELLKHYGFFPGMYVAKESYKLLLQLEQQDPELVADWTSNVAYLERVAKTTKLKASHQAFLNKERKREREEKRKAEKEEKLRRQLEAERITPDRKSFILYPWLGVSARDVMNKFGAEDYYNLNNDEFGRTCIGYGECLMTRHVWACPDRLNFCLDSDKNVVAVHYSFAQSNLDHSAPPPPKLSSLLPSSFELLTPTDEGGKLIYKIGPEKWEFRYYEANRVHYDIYTESYQQEFYKRVLSISIYKN